MTTASDAAGEPYDSGPMFELTVERVFSAAHAILIGGVREPVHGHDWRVRVTVAGPELDAEDLLCDFHALEGSLDRVIAPFRNADLNRTPPFDHVNPTAEAVARHIAHGVAADLPPGVRLAAVALTEAPGCEAVYRPDART
jgi:6-pyruvoyltetrahydropterin/6-carboxytetrahydropterin synthase